MSSVLTAPIFAPLVHVPAACQMIEQAGPTAIGANQVTEVIAPGDNTRGMTLITFYTQVIQAGSPGNTAQSLLLAAATAPTDFASKTNCLPIYRTYQNDKQSPVSLDGYGPLNILNLSIPANWGIWQIATVVGAALDRNNMRLGVVIY